MTSSLSLSLSSSKMKEVCKALIDHHPTRMNDDDDDVQDSQSEVSLDESIETEVEYDDDDDDDGTKQLKSPVTKSLFPIGKEVLYFPREGEQGTCLVCVFLCVCVCLGERRDGFVSFFDGRDAQAVRI
jgi:hypothetical protein